LELVIVLLMLGALIGVMRINFDQAIFSKLLPFFVVAFFGRLIIHVAVLRSGLLNYGGDCVTYEELGQIVASIWRIDGFSFVTEGENPALHSVAVPVNIFAFIQYVCGSNATLACTSFVAFVAGALCVVVFRFSQLIGADDGAATRLTLLTLFGPSFIIHTSDTYKDGINAFLVVTALYVAVRVAQKVSFISVIAVSPLLWCLWYVRPYMVFMCALPLALGVIGIKRALSVWSVSLMVLALVGGLILSGADGGRPEALDIAQEQFDRASSTAVREDAAQGGSGVTFDDGGNAWGALGPKILYTLLSPFPWASGSVAFQLGKIETMLWYYLLYCAIRGLPWFWKNDRQTLFLIGLFVIPSTLAYATSMANVGLIFRQRMPITIMVSLLSSVVWTRSSASGQKSRAGLPLEQRAA
jgi:hypothetical protein